MNYLIQPVVEFIQSKQVSYWLLTVCTAHTHSTHTHTHTHTQHTHTAHSTQTGYFRQNVCGPDVSRPKQANNRITHGSIAALNVITLCCWLFITSPAWGTLFYFDNVIIQTVCNAFVVALFLDDELGFGESKLH